MCQPLLSECEFREVQAAQEGGGLGPERAWRIPCQLRLKLFLAHDKHAALWHSMHAEADVRFFASYVRLCLCLSAYAQQCSSAVAVARAMLSVRAVRAAGENPAGQVERQRAQPARQAELLGRGRRARAQARVLQRARRLALGRVRALEISKLCSVLFHIPLTSRHKATRQLVLNYIILH